MRNGLYLKHQVTIGGNRPDGLVNNQFQFVVPVKRDAGKIQWNGARISIVWKFCSCVLLGFVIILIIIDLQINLLLSEWFMDERQDRLT
mgnify:FL=1